MIKLSSGVPYQEGTTSITVSGGSVTTDYINFEQTFNRVPEVLVVPPFAAEGTYAAIGVTAEKFKIDVSGETAADLTDATFRVQWIAVEPL